MCCSTKISKLLLFIFNIIFFLFGAALLAVGIFLLVDKTYLVNIIGKIPTSSSFDVNTVLNTTSYLENSAYILIGVGAGIFFIAFCGLCGGIRESSCLLYIFAVFVGLILAIQVTAGILCAFYGSMVETYLLSWLTTLVEGYYYGATMTNGVLAQSTDSTGVSDAIDYLQVSMSCCGMSSKTDYQNATNWPGYYNFTSGGSVVTVTNALVPVTCCKMTNPSAWPGSISTIAFTDLNDCLTTASATNTNTASCYNTVLALLKKYLKYVIGAGVGLAFIELFGIIAACCIIQNKNRADKVQSM